MPHCGCSQGGLPPTPGRPCPPSLQDCGPQNRSPATASPWGLREQSQGATSSCPGSISVTPLGMGPEGRGQRAEHGPTRPRQGGSVGLPAPTGKEPRVSRHPHPLGWLSRSARGAECRRGVEARAPHALLRAGQAGAARPESRVEGPRKRKAEPPTTRASDPGSGAPRGDGIAVSEGQRRESAQPGLDRHKEEETAARDATAGLEGIRLSGASRPEDRRRAVSAARGL